MLPHQDQFLNLLDFKELPATDGRKPITESSDVFTGVIDSKFKKYGTDVHGGATNSATAMVYEVKRNGNCQCLFASYGIDWRDRVLELGQVSAFCAKYPELLSQNGHGTLFLTQAKKEGINYQFCALVYMSANRQIVSVSLRLLDDLFIWNADETRLILLE